MRALIEPMTARPSATNASDASDQPELERSVLVVGEHTLVAAGLELALAERSWTVGINCGSSSDEVLDHIAAFRPRCVLMDFQPRSGAGRNFELIRPAVSLGTAVVMLTSERRRAVLAACLEAGAAGWIKMTADLDEVDSTLADVVAGRPIIGRTERAELLELLRTERAAVLRAESTFSQLTQREALVLAALTQGLSADEIATAHFVALTTVRSQIRSILQKLGVRTQLAAVALADSHRALLPREATAGTDRRRSGSLSIGSDPFGAVRSA
jgi:two-component system, NarL family, nitrate/nitrite response regulator NarL